MNHEEKRQHALELIESLKVRVENHDDCFDDVIEELESAISFLD